MNGNGIWIQRQHLRWLVVLLALLPLPPAVMLARIILENAERDRIEAIESETGVYREQLKTLVNRTSMSPPAEDGADGLFERLQRIFGDEVTLIMASPDGGWQRSTGPPPTEDAIDIVIQEGGFADWSVKFDRVLAWPDYIWEFRRAALRRAAITVLTVILVAGAVWFAINRGLQIDELRSDLLSTISHEMRTPLASMRLLLETLESGTVSDPEAKQEYFGLLSRENKRLARLTDNFLLYRRLERGEFKLRTEPIQLGPIVDSVWKEVTLAFPQTTGELVKGQGMDIVILTDESALSSVLRNLFENSLKYGGNPVRVEITARMEPRERVRIAIFDSGPGIPKAEHRRIFAPFYRSDSRLDDVGAGTGLGLAITRRLVRQLKGKIRVESMEKGKGSRFVIEFPGSGKIA